MTTEPQPPLQVLCRAPRLYVIDDFASGAEVDDVLALLADPIRLALLGVETARSVAGVAGELPVTGDAVLTALAERTYARLGFGNVHGQTLRFRRYAVGEYHPPHVDQYEAAGAWLVATALLYLTDTEAGGETHFPAAQPGPVAVAPRRGRLALWFNHTPDGAVDPASRHAALAVRAGEKATLGNFIYQPLSAAAGEPR